MRRFISTLILAGLVVTAFAQAPFTIARPADGSKVKEVVRVQIPKGAIPTGAYIGVFVNGKFVEALVPDAVGNFYVYELDTKARGIQDGPATIKVVMYQDTGSGSRKVDESEVEVTVENSASIAIPDEGLLLRYRFQPGAEYIYDLNQRVSFSQINTAQAQMGSRASETIMESEAFRMAYEVVNRFPDGDGLIRMQPLPQKGKPRAFLRTVQDPNGRYFQLYEMHPLYMRVSPTGLERFGSAPIYYPMEGSSAESRTDLFAAYPLPTLPERRQRPGDSWQTRFQLGALDMNNLREQEKITEQIIARGEFVRVEWEMGHPCALIRHTLDVGARSTEGQQAASQLASGQRINEAQKIVENIWFALDKGMVIRLDRELTFDTRIQAAAPAAGGGAGQGGFGGGPGGGPSMAGASGAGGGGAAGANRIGPGGSNDFRQGIGQPPGGYQGGPGGPPGGPPRGGFGPGSAPPPPGGPGGGVGQMGGPGAGGFGRGAGRATGGNQTMIQRVVLLQSFRLAN
ncbi:MAG: hypothetical protein ACK4XJ_08615 [Fimbriimonadaceae bacterium]